MAAAGGIVGGAGAWGGLSGLQYGGQLAAFAAAPAAGASAAAISGSDPGVGALIAVSAAAFSLGVQQAYKSLNAHVDHQGRSLTNQERALYDKHVSRQTLDAAKIHEGVVPKWLRSDMSGITLKTDIYFREGVYVPNTASGVEILGHELTHVQQYLNGMSYLDYIFSSWKGYMNNPYEIEAYSKEADIRMNFCVTNPGKSGC